METCAPLINAIVNNVLSEYTNNPVNNALFHPNAHINQIPPQIIHILRFFW